LTGLCPVEWCTEFTIVVNPARIAPASTGVAPYVVASVSWLADSRRPRGSRLGTEASFAGPHAICSVSIANVATAAQPTTSRESLVMSVIPGIDANSRKRPMSQTTIVYRRSQRSATTPASGPMIRAGSMRTATTDPNAAPLAAEPLTCWLAKIDEASRPSQSPREESPSTSHSRRNGRMRRIALSPAAPDRSTGDSDTRPRGSDVVAMAVTSARTGCQAAAPNAFTVAALRIEDPAARRPALRETISHSALTD
jgi:hypothetical protein